MTAINVAPTWAVFPVESCWRVTLDDDTRGVIRVDDQGRPVGVMVSGRLTTQMSKRLTSARVTNAIAAQQVLGA